MLMVFRNSWRKAFISGVIFRRAGVNVPSTSKSASVRLEAGMLAFVLRLSAVARREAASAAARLTGDEWLSNKPCYATRCCKTGKQCSARAKFLPIMRRASVTPLVRSGSSPPTHPDVARRVKTRSAARRRALALLAPPAASLALHQLSQRQSASPPANAAFQRETLVAPTNDYKPAASRRRRRRSSQEATPV